MEGCYQVKMAKAKFAGEVFKAAKNAAGATGKFLGLDKMSNVEKALRFGPDALVAAGQMYYTPGDLGDKLIAGGTDFLISSGGGLLAAAPFKGNPGIAGTVDTAVSIGAGMFAAHPASEALQRAKDKAMGGQGLSAYDKANAEYERQLRQSVIEELDAKGLLNANIRGLIPDEVGALQ